MIHAICYKIKQIRGVTVLYPNVIPQPGTIQKTRARDFPDTSF